MPLLIYTYLNSLSSLQMMVIIRLFSCHNAGLREYLLFIVNVRVDN